MLIDSGRSFVARRRFRRPNAPATLCNVFRKTLGPHVSEHGLFPIRACADVLLRHARADGWLHGCAGMHDTTTEKLTDDLVGHDYVVLLVDSDATRRIIDACKLTDRLYDIPISSVALNHRFYMPED